MKFLNFAILLSCLVLVSSNAKYSDKKNHKKTHFKHKQTPKAFDLNNHFGYSSVDSPYGPHHNKLIVVNAVPSVAVVPQCVISVQPFYDHCSPFVTCGSCTSSPYCGRFCFIKFLNFNSLTQDGAHPFSSVFQGTSIRAHAQTFAPIIGTSRFNTAQGSSLPIE